MTGGDVRQEEAARTAVNYDHSCFSRHDDLAPGGGAQSQRATSISTRKLCDVLPTLCPKAIARPRTEDREERGPSSQEMRQRADAARPPHGHCHRKRAYTETEEREKLNSSSKAECPPPKRSCAGSRETQEDAEHQLEHLMRNLYISCPAKRSSPDDGHSSAAAPPCKRGRSQHREGAFPEGAVRGEKCVYSHGDNSHRATGQKRAFWHSDERSEPRGEKDKQRSLKRSEQGSCWLQRSLSGGQGVRGLSDHRAHQQHGASSQQQAGQSSHERLPPVPVPSELASSRQAHQMQGVGKRKHPGTEEGESPAAKKHQRAETHELQFTVRNYR